jgi:hypothetical protein
MATRLFHMIAVTDAGAWIVRSDGYVAALSTALLPDVAFLAGVRARFAVLSRYTVLVNAVSAPIWFDTDATSHYLSIREPSAPPSAAAGAGTGLTGDYKAWVSFSSRMRSATSSPNRRSRARRRR